MKALLVSPVVCLLLASAGPAAAKPRPKTPTPQVKVLRGPDGRITYRFKGLILYGKAHQPHAMLTLERQRGLYRAALPRKALTRRIPAAVRHRPF